MYLQNFSYDLSRKEKPNEVFQRICQFLRTNDMHPQQILFFFDDRYTAKFSACERVVKSFPDLAIFLKEGTPSASHKNGKVLSNLSAVVNDPGIHPNFAYPTVDSQLGKQVSLDTISSLIDGVPKRFPFNHVKVCLGNVEWAKDDNGPVLRKSGTDTGFMVQLTSNWWVNGRLSSLVFQIETECDPAGNPAPLKKELTDGLALIGKIDKKKTQIFSPESVLQKLQSRPKVSDAARIQARQVYSESQQYLLQLYAEKEFPHYLEDYINEQPGLTSKQSIPRKSIILKAFKGFTAEETGSGTLDIVKRSDKYTFSCFFDFGTWSEKMSVHMKAQGPGGRGYWFTLPVMCWADPADVPITSESFFRKAIDNAAFAAAEIERKYLPKIVEILEASNN